ITVDQKRAASMIRSVVAMARALRTRSRSYPRRENLSSRPLLFDHPIRPQQERLGNRQTERRRGLETEHELALGRLLDRQVRRASAPEYLVDVRGRTAHDLVDVWAVGEEGPAFGPGSPAGGQREAGRRGELQNPLARQCHQPRRDDDQRVY